MEHNEIESIQEVANFKISQKIKEVYRLIQECEILAKESKVEFSLSVSYGMGGYYDPAEGWISSSASC